jgi:2-oxoglutarate dehydrogenase E2 component (dihydrolipoamide succinyltransferase)
MAIVEVKVPQLSESVAEATLLQWKKKPGDAVAIDEIIIEVETDKVVLEVPAPAAGVLAQIVCDDGATVVSDQVIATHRHRRQDRGEPARKAVASDAAVAAAALAAPPAAAPTAGGARPMWPCPLPPS